MNSLDKWCYGAILDQKWAKKVQKRHQNTKIVSFSTFKATRTPGILNTWSTSMKSTIHTSQGIYILDKWF